MNIKVIKADITEIEAEAIVNAANTSLMGGGGVDGAIHRKGGPQILEACRAIVARQGGCKTGNAVWTEAGRLPARFVIHTVGPIWNGGKKKEAELLRQCYQSSLELAKELSVKSIAFPNISTGIYRFPKQLAAEIAVEAVREHLAAQALPEEVLFVCFDDENFLIYKELLG